jgi:hypothetical protein
MNRNLGYFISVLTIAVVGFIARCYFGYDIFSNIVYGLLYMVIFGLSYLFILNLGPIPWIIEVFDRLTTGLYILLETTSSHIRRYLKIDNGIVDRQYRNGLIIFFVLPPIGVFFWCSTYASSSFKALNFFMDFLGEFPQIYAFEIILTAALLFLFFRRFFRFLSIFLNRLLRQFFKSAWGQLIIFAITLISILFAAYQDIIQSNGKSMWEVMEIGYEAQINSSLVTKEDIDKSFVLNEIETEKHVYTFLVDASGSNKALEEEGKKKNNGIYKKLKDRLIKRVEKKLKEKKDVLSKSLEKLIIPELITIESLLTLGDTLQINNSLIEIFQYEMDQNKNKLVKKTEIAKGNYVLNQYIKTVDKEDKKLADESNFSQIFDSLTNRLESNIKKGILIREDDRLNTVYHIVVISDFKQASAIEYENSVASYKIEQVKKKIVKEHLSLIKGFYFHSILIDTVKSDLVLESWNSYTNQTSNKVISIPKMIPKIVEDTSNSIFLPEFSQLPILKLKPIIIPHSLINIDSAKISLKDISYILGKINKNDTLTYGLSLNTEPYAGNDLATNLEYRNVKDSILQAKAPSNISKKEKNITFFERLSSFYLRIGTLNNKSIKQSVVEVREVLKMNDWGIVGKIKEDDEIFVYNLYPHKPSNLQIEFIPNAVTGRRVVFPIEFQRVPNKAQHIYMFFLLIILVLSVIPPLIIRRVFSWDNILNINEGGNDIRWNRVNIIISGFAIVAGYVIVYKLFNLNFMFFDLSRHEDVSYKFFHLTCLLLPFFSLLYFMANPINENRQIGDRNILQVQNTINNLNQDIGDITAEIRNQATQIQNLNNYTNKIDSVMKQILFKLRNRK